MAIPSRFPAAVPPPSSPTSRFGWRFAPDHIALVALAELDRLRRALDHHCAAQNMDAILRETVDDLGCIDNLLSAPSGGGMGLGDDAWRALSKTRAVIAEAVKGAEEQLLSADDLVETRQRHALSIAAMIHRHFEETGQ